MADSRSAADRCPLCGGDNGCALAAAAGASEASCWCEGAAFSAALLARVPGPLRGAVCICAACAAAAGTAAGDADRASTVTPRR